MSRSSLPDGPLRIVLTAITLVTIIAFATVGYSVYQVIVTSSGETGSPVNPANLGQNATLVNDTVTINLAGSFANNGLYPLDYLVYANASTPAGSLANVTAPSQSIGPGQVARLNLSLDMDLFTTGGPAANDLFYNGSSLQLNEGAKTSIGGLVALRVSNGTSVLVPAFLGSLQVKGENSSSGSVSFLMTFDVGPDASFGFTMYGQLSDGMNSTVFTGVASPGANLEAEFSFSGQNLGGAPYAIKLHTVAFGHDFVTVLEVGTG
ncbi:MAG: hypothetical protein OK456_07025 [Thaumarchaeota archaeon]|nr:hypothetical protein [Nitrososphaerota archaeon]